MDIVMTCVAGEGALTTAELNQLLQTLKDMKVDRVSPPLWLAQDQAVDVIVNEASHALLSHLRAQLVFEGIDIFVQPLEGRRKKLLMADMDSTIVKGETLDDLAAMLGIKDQVAQITAQAMRGEIDFHDALQRRVALIEGLSVIKMLEVVENISFNTGAATLVKTMSAQGARCVLISGGFDVFTQKVGAELGFWKTYGNRLEIVGEKLTGRVIPPIIDKHVKKSYLEQEVSALGIMPGDVLAVGDGANDVLMLQAAGSGIGYYAKPAVNAAVPFQIKYTDLTSLLFMQGIHLSNFITH